MAQALRKKGFEVIEVVNGTRRDMRLATIEFADLLLAGGLPLTIVPIGLLEPGRLDRLALLAVWARSSAAPAGFSGSASAA